MTMLVRVVTVVLSSVLSVACGPSVGVTDSESDTLSTSETDEPTDPTDDPTDDPCADGGDCCYDDPCCDDPCCGDPCCGDPCCAGDSDGGGCNDDDLPPEPCELVDCGNGQCVYDDAGQPRCECPPDEVSLGLACMTCVAVAAGYDIDVRTAELRLRVTLAGGPAPETALDSASLSLRGSDGELVELGSTHEGELVALVVPGRYRLIYSYLAGELMPRNTAATLGWIDVQASMELAIDLQPIELGGDFTIDGATAPASAYENGRVSLRNGDGDEVVLGETATGGFTTSVLPGSYEVYYEWIAGTEVVPRNPRHTVTLIELAGDEGSVTVAIDIPTVQLQGAITIAGLPAPESDEENGRLSLVGSDPLDAITLAETRDGVFEGRVVAGYYRVVYEHIAGELVVPANLRAELAEVELSSPGVLDIDVPSVSMGGSFTLDGAAPPSELGGDGLLSLATATGDRVELGRISAGSYQRMVVPGAYDLAYTSEADGTVLPTNSDALLATPIVDGAPLDIDVPTIAVSGAITIDGATPPVMDDGGTIGLRTDRGDVVELASTGAAVFAVLVVPGDYEVTYAVASAAIVAPENALASIGEVQLGADSELAIDVPTMSLSGAITLDGAAPPADPVGELRLWDPHTAAVWSLGTTGDGGYQSLLVPGRYVVRYGVPEAAPPPTTSLPRNRDAALACIELSR